MQTGLFSGLSELAVQLPLVAPKQPQDTKPPGVEFCRKMMIPLPWPLGPGVTSHLAPGASFKRSCATTSYRSVFEPTSTGVPPVPGVSGASRPQPAAAAAKRTIATSLFIQVLPNGNVGTVSCT